jgi:hypothetical protein
MNAMAQYAGSDCGDLGWIKQGTYIERPYSTAYLVTRYIPCEHCHAALTNPRPDSMSVVANAVPTSIKPIAIPGRNNCGHCQAEDTKSSTFRSAPALLRSGYHVFAVKRSSFDRCVLQSPRDPGSTSSAISRKPTASRRDLIQEFDCQI